MTKVSQAQLESMKPNTTDDSRRSIKRKKTVNVCQSGKIYKISKNTIKEIRNLQHSVQLLIPRLSFSRLTAEIICESLRTSKDMRIQKTALEALQVAAETYLTQFFEDANLLAAHANRITLKIIDMQLVHMLRSNFDIVSNSALNP